MIRILPLPILRRRGRHTTPLFQGAILSKCLVTWRCGHAHERKIEAQQCAEHEAARRRIPFSSSLNGDAHEGPAVND